MTRLFCIGIVAAAVLFAVPAFASVPLPANCDVSWYLPVDLDTLILVCPSGDGQTKLDVTIRDQFNLPVTGQIVTASFADARVIEGAISGVTDANGYVRLALPAGLDCSAGRQPRVYSEWSVSSMGITIRTATTYLVSPDLNGDGVVSPLDNALFVNDYGAIVGLQRCDFNGDSSVGPLDNAQFIAHYGD